MSSLEDEIELWKGYSVGDTKDMEALAHRGLPVENYGFPLYMVEGSLMVLLAIAAPPVGAVLGADMAVRTVRGLGGKAPVGLVGTARDLYRLVSDKYQGAKAPE